MTTVTVVLTTHDRAALADRALASIRAQTHEVDHVIVVDDASREPYRPPDDHVTLVRNPVSVGVCAARNHALSLATTELIMFLDDDDWLGDDFIAEQVRGLAQTTLPAPVAGIGTRVFVGGHGGDHRSDARSYAKGESWLDDSASTAENTLVAPVSALRAIGGFDEELSSWEHVDLMQRLLEVCSIEHNPGAEYFSPEDDGIPRLSSSWGRVANAIELTMAKHDDKIRRDPRAPRPVPAGRRRRTASWPATAPGGSGWRCGRSRVLPDRRSAKTLVLAVVGPRLFTSARRVAGRRRRAEAPAFRRA